MRWVLLLIKDCESSMINSEPIRGEGVEVEIGQSSTSTTVATYALENGSSEAERSLTSSRTCLWFQTETGIFCYLSSKNWICLLQNDSWKPYDVLSDEGYTHLKDNHSIEFTNIETGATPTTWVASCQAQLSYGEVQHLWRRKIENGDNSESFLHTIRQTYNRQEWLVPGE